MLRQSAAQSITSIAPPLGLRAYQAARLSLPPSLWFKVDELPSGSMPLVDGVSLESDGHIALNAKEIGSGNSGKIQPKEWNHLVVTSKAIYLNGQTFSVTHIPPIGDTFELGTVNTTAPMQEVLVYNRQLNADEVQSLYANGRQEMTRSFSSVLPTRDAFCGIDVLVRLAPIKDKFTTSHLLWLQCPLLCLVRWQALYKLER